MNSAAEVLLGLSRERIIGQDLERWLRLDTDLSTQLRVALDTRRPMVLRARHLKPLRAESFPADLIITPLQDEAEDEAGDPVRLLFELNAIGRHDRITREERLQQEQSITRTVTRGLAHEIKNPLSGLRGAAQLMAAEWGSDPEVREYTEIIIREADRLRGLVDRMLGPSNLPQYGTVNLHEVLEHVRGLVRVQLPAEVSIRCDYDPSIPALWADRDMLVQAVLNLVQNAVHALGERGEIVLVSRILRQHTLAGQRHRLVARLSVHDDGPGIPDAIRDRIFFPMVTGHAAGTGLGLPIAQNLIQLHEGQIEYDSRPGATRFDILLPIREPAD